MKLYSWRLESIKRFFIPRIIRKWSSKRQFVTGASRRNTLADILSNMPLLMPLRHVRLHQTPNKSSLLVIIVRQDRLPREWCRERGARGRLHTTSIIRLTQQKHARRRNNLPTVCFNVFPVRAASERRFDAILRFLEVWKMVYADEVVTYWWLHLNRDIIHFSWRSVFRVQWKHAETDG